MVLFPLMYPITYATEYFGGDRQHDVDVVDHQMPFFDLVLALLSQTAQFSVDRLLPVLLDEDHVMLTCPLQCDLDSDSASWGLPFVMLW